MADEPQGDKKHEATPQKLQRAREEGQVARSTDLAAAIVLLLAIAFIMVFGEYISGTLFEYSEKMLLEPQLLGLDERENEALEQSVQSLFHETIMRFMWPFSFFFILLLLTAIIANLMQIGFLWTPKKLAPDIKHIDPVKGFKRMFSMQSVVRLLMGIGKILICVVVAWYAIVASIGEILHLCEQETNEIAAFLVWMILMVALKIAVAMVIIALLDLMYQQSKFMRDQRMTDEEMRREIKNIMGDPQIIQKRRQIQYELARKQRVQGTQDADVVVTNPTHYAVGIKFDYRTMNYPVVVSKGEDYLAFQIRKIAAEHRIPIVRRPLLARTLFDKIEIGSPVTPAMIDDEHMKTLAEVIAFAYRMSGRGNVMREPDDRS